MEILGQFLEYFWGPFLIIMAIARRQIVANVTRHTFKYVFKNSQHKHAIVLGIIYGLPLCLVIVTSFDVTFFMIITLFFLAPFLLVEIIFYRALNYSLVYYLFSIIYFIFGLALVSAGYIPAYY